ncbi:hypothetical protein MMC13_007508 [Lambiella insularis]|nr:hypothetical protein [Lambiella insularis]
MQNLIDLRYLFNLISQSSLSPSEKSSYYSFCKDLVKLPSKNAAALILAAEPLATTPSYIPLASLSYVLTTFSGSWPVFDLIRCHSRLWRALPEEAKSGHASDNIDLVVTACTKVKSSYRDLLDLLPLENEKPAIQEAQSHRCLTHRKLSRFLRNFSLPIRSQRNAKPVVVVALPNGPLLALACVAVATYYTAAPINSSSGAEQFRKDVQQTQSKTVLTMRAEIRRLGLEDPWVSDAGIAVLIVDENPDMTFSVTPLLTPASSIQSHHVANGPDDLSLILFTSGTSGTKKVVPLSLHNIVSGVAFVVESWGLTENDVCLNMMPLNHVGGLVRNLFAPILAGGSTICCPAFDANLFWDVVEERSPTWYYASPSMHSTILEEVKDRSVALSRSRIRLVCNAAGGLLPSLALQLRETFRSVVLPSYGMTECMPISTPPLNYQLDRAGTSGISVGPELAILDGNGKRLPVHEIGRIGVRGAPVFPGYLKASQIDTSVFTSDGWFDTGDMGYLDQDGYLYLTGRSKEVVNRGGELISPFEVEEAIMVASKNPNSQLFNRVSEVLVFSAPHDVLQEVVGVVVVTPVGMPRTDLRQLHEAIKLSLHQSKWPFVIVYMDAVPKNNNKLLRMRLGERLGFAPFSDGMTLANRHFEAKCPPPDTSLSVPVEKSFCQIDLAAVSQVMKGYLTPAFQVYVGRSAHDGLPEVVVSPQVQDPTFAAACKEQSMTQEQLFDSLDGYLVPGKVSYIETPFPVDKDGLVDEEKLKVIIRNKNTSSPNSDNASTKGKICNIFAAILACSPSDISTHSDFFEMGGDSLKAGRLLSMLRKEFQVRIPIGTLFQKSRVDDLCEIINESLGTATEDQVDRSELPLPGCSATYSSTNIFLLLIQLIPIGILYPMKSSLKWIFFLYILISFISVWPDETTIVIRFIMLLFAMVLSKLAIHICAPLAAIAAKWAIIGRYKEGLYPMWGLYHTRWWFVQKILSVGGRGIFGYTDTTRILYYRLLGAKIGKGVSIAETAVLGEYDLLDIGDNVELDTCICRAFAVERNTSMYLCRIALGTGSSVGLKSFVAPGTNLPMNTHIGPASSSWETKDATEANRDLSSRRVPKSPAILSLLLGIPVKSAVAFISLLPWMAGLLGVIMDAPGDSGDVVAAVVIWFSEAKRVGFHFLARTLSVSIGPFAFLSMVVLVKLILDRFIRKVEPGPAANRSQLQKFRMSLMQSLLPKGDVSSLADLFGTHYEFTSMVVRALGGKIGSRVYWPGNGPTIQDFELLEIGDNVVFGSRSHIITSDGTGSEKVIIGDGAMVADRVIILPGTTLGKNTVLGSGALTRRNMSYPSDTVWVGSKEGGAVCLTAPDRSAHKSQSLNVPQTAFSSASSISSRNTVHSSRLSAFSYHSNDSYQHLIGTRPETASTSVEDLEKTLPANPSSYALLASVWTSQKPAQANASKRKSKTSTDPNSSPFGKAFYEGKATYYVLGMPIIFLYSLLTNIFVTVYWNIGPITAIQVLAKALKAHPAAFGPGPVRPIAIYALFLAVMIVIMAFQAVIALSIMVGAKWALMGRRTPGKYDWDTSSYCQRWQVFLTVERLRRQCYGGNGIIGLLTGTHFAVLYFRALGATIGKDCALWAGGYASLLFTEPDLLTLGDRVAVDDASLVAHINSRGNFSLNPLSVGDRSVLRSGSRLLSGATMGADCCLLEHTLIMAGDVVDSGTTHQGWPADEFVGDRCAPSIAGEKGRGSIAGSDSAMGSFEALIKTCPA